MEADMLRSGIRETEVRSFASFREHFYTKKRHLKSIAKAGAARLQTIIFRHTDYTLHDVSSALLCKNSQFHRVHGYAKKFLLALSGNFTLKQAFLVRF